MFKFPNAIIHGEPTINNGQVNGFSQSNYLVLPFALEFTGRAFEMTMAFTTSSDVTSAQNIFGGPYCLASYIQNEKLYFNVSSNGISWDLINYVSNFNIEANKTYYVKFAFTGIDYKVSYSLNGIDYIEDDSIGRTQWPHNGTVYIGVGNNFNNPFKGIINFNKCEIKVGGIIFWEGMDDVGLATRLATDLDNIDEEGIERIKEIARDGVNLDNKIDTDDIPSIMSDYGIKDKTQISRIETDIANLEESIAEIDTKEDVSNKTTTLSSTSTDTQYPSAKAVYDELSTKITKDEKIVVKTTAMDTSKGKPVQEAGNAEIYKDGIAFSNPATKNDAGWVRVTGTGENDTVLEIATGNDNGNGETIMFRGYGSDGVPSYQVEVPKANGTLVLEEVLENNNLLTYPYYCFQKKETDTITQNGLTVALREDGTILLNGAYAIDDETLPNLNLSLTDNNFILKKGKTYTVSHNLNIIGVRVRFEPIDPPQPLEDMSDGFVFNVSTGGVSTKTMSQDIRGRFYLSIAHRDKELNGKTEPLIFDNVEFKPMVELSIKAHEFITPKVSSEAVNLWYSKGIEQPCELVTYNTLKQFYQRHDTVKVYGGLENNFTTLSLGGTFDDEDTARQSEGRVVLHTNTENDYTIAVKPDNTIQNNISVILPKTSGTLALDNLVTGTDKGLMDPADKIKLDNLTPVRKILSGGAAGSNNVLIYDHVNNIYSYNELCMFSGSKSTYARITLGGAQVDNDTTIYKRGSLELYDTNNNKGELQYNNGGFTSNQNGQTDLGSNSLQWKTGWFVNLQTSTINGTSADYSEMFEWSDGNIYNDDRRGLFVVYDKENIKPDKDIMIKVFDYQKDSIDDIVGIVSSSPLIVGDSDGEEWINKYMYNEFGKIKTTLEKEPAIYLKTYPAEYDKDGNLIREEYIEETTEKTDKLYKEESYKEVPILNPDYNPNLKYVSRKERKEWDCIGFMGKIIMVDDGTCKIGSYVKPTEDNTGRATYSDSRTNFTAIKRIDDTHIKVLVK